MWEVKLKEKREKGEKMRKKEIGEKSVHEKEVEKRGNKILELVKQGIEYNLEDLENLVREKTEGKGIFAVLEFEFNEAIIDLLNRKKLEGIRNEKTSYRGISMGKHKRAIIIGTSQIASVKKVL